MSTPLDERWDEIEPWLDRLLDQPPTLRNAWLSSHCDDPGLRALLLSLLDADALRADALEAHARRARLDAEPDWPEIPGYRLLRLLGEGGMASVFLAERALGNTRQQVALKRLRVNVFDPVERRRFEHEHRILARLEHPGIARLLDAGIGPDGVPWFALEYVQGEPLVAWCSARRLGLEERLALFCAICEAVHHAHQHLVIHRDLKPGNVLVDQSGHVRLLDFGIARLLDAERDATGTGARRLTPGYAAPEQFEGEATTATDVYALGVILLELVTGTRPARRDATSDPLHGLSADAKRGVEAAPGTLQRWLAGDLGAIARKALRHDPAARYGSVQALRDDVRAFLQARPVAARRGNWRYRSGLFLRRHALAAGASALLLALLVGAVVFSMEQAGVARLEAQRAQAVQGFVEDMLAPLRQGVPTRRMPALEEVLDRGVKALERSSHDSAVQSELLVMLARTYDHMGDIDTARSLAERAHRLGVDAFGNDDPRTVEALAMRGRMRGRHGDGAGARADLDAAHAAMQRQGIGGAPYAAVLDDLGQLRLDATDPDGAEVFYLRARDERLRVFGPRAPELAFSYSSLGAVHEQRGDLPRALALYEQAWRHCVAHEGADTRQAAVHLGRVGQVKCRLGRWREGAAAYSQALAVFEQLGAGDHPERLFILESACFDRILLDDESSTYCEDAVGMARRLFGESSSHYWRARRARMAWLVMVGDFAQARAEGETLRAELKTATHATPSRAMTLDRLLSDIPRLEADFAALRDMVLPIVLSAPWKGQANEAALHAKAALACGLSPHPDCPSDLEARTEALLASAAHVEHPLRIEAQLARIMLALRRGEIDDAQRRLDDIAHTAALPHVQLAPAHLWLVEARLWQGDVHAARGDASRARAEWQAAHDVFAARFEPSHPLSRLAAERLAP